MGLCHGDGLVSTDVEIALLTVTVGLGYSGGSVVITFSTQWMLPSAVFLCRVTACFVLLPKSLSLDFGPSIDLHEHSVLTVADC